jgi:hypothetical protein
LYHEERQRQLSIKQTGRKVGSLNHFNYGLSMIFRDGYPASLIYGRDPERVENGFAATVAAILKYVGMKIRTTKNILSLLILLPSDRRSSWVHENSQLS